MLEAVNILKALNVSSKAGAVMAKFDEDGNGKLDYQVT